MSESRVYDLFISYAHLDNRAISEGRKGWISSFHYSLDVRLSQLLGRKPLIWRDYKLQGNDKFEKEIELKFLKTKIFLAVISPCYLQSKWCMKEMRAFIKEAGNREGVHIGNKSRIFKIVKTYVHDEEQPEDIRGLLGYEFFRKDERERYVEFSPEIGGRFHQEFLDKLEDVAFDICHLIKEMEREKLEPPLEDPIIPSRRLLLSDFSVEELDRELIARAAQIPDGKLFKFKDSEGTPQRNDTVMQLKEFYDCVGPPYCLWFQNVGFPNVGYRDTR